MDHLDLATGAPVKLFATSSARVPCGIADYHAELLKGFSSTVQVQTVSMPVTHVSRARPAALLHERGRILRLARSANAADGVLVQYHPRIWNYTTRRGEDLFGLFLKRVRRPVVVVVHELAEPIGEAAPTGRWAWLKSANVMFWEWLNQSQDAALAGGLAGCRAVIAHSPELAAWLAAGGVPPERIWHRVHPVFPTPEQPVPVAQITARFGLGGKQVVILFGFVDPRKGFDLAVDAVAGLPDDAVLVWAGGAGESAAAKQLETLATARLGSRFVRAGYLSEPELAGLFACATVALAPFRSVTGSGSVSRLVAARVPTITSDLPALRNLYDEGAGLKLVPPGASEPLRAALTELLTHPEAAGELRAKSQAFAARHTFAGLAHEIQEAYR